MSDLSDSRPTVFRRQVWCDFCNKQVDGLMQTGVHKTKRGTFLPSGDGVIMLRAFCGGPDHPGEGPYIAWGDGPDERQMLCDCSKGKDDILYYADLAVTFANARDPRRRYVAFAPTLLELPQDAPAEALEILAPPERQKPSPRLKRGEGQLMLPFEGS